MNEVRGPDVVAGWGLANGVLVAILIGYGESWIPIALYAGSVALIEVVAVVTWWVLRHRPEWAAASPAPRRTRAGLLGALVALLIGAGLVWNWWLALPAAYPALALAVEAVTPAETVDLPSGEPRPAGRPQPSKRDVAGGALLGLVAIVARRRAPRGSS